MPRVGERVLVASTLDGECFVLGVFRTEAANDREVRQFQVEQRGAATVLSVEGDLELRAASGSVRIEARDGLDLRGGVETRISAGGALANSKANASTLLMRESGLRIEAPAVDATVETAKMKATEVSVATETMSLIAKKATHTIGLLDVRATRIIERAKNVFRDVEDQMQTRAGRIRVVAEQTYNLMSKRVLVKAHEDVKLKGEKIYLG